MATDTLPTVFVVDEDPRVLALYEEFLSGEYAVLTARGPDQALTQLHGDVAVVVLDEQLLDRVPGPGFEALRDNGFDGPVALITTEPPADVNEFVDGFLVKPVTKDDLRALVRTLLKRDAYHEAVQEYFTVVTSVASIEANRRMRGPASRDEYAELCEQLAAIETRARSRLAEIAEDGYEALFRDL